MEPGALMLRSCISFEIYSAGAPGGRSPGCKVENPCTPEAPASSHFPTRHRSGIWHPGVRLWVLSHGGYLWECAGRGVSAVASADNAFFIRCLIVNIEGDTV